MGPKPPKRPPPDFSELPQVDHSASDRRWYREMESEKFDKLTSINQSLGCILVILILWCVVVPFLIFLIFLSWY